jgi:hypothetical protein
MFSTGLSTGDFAGRQQGDVLGHGQLGREMPAGLIEQDDDVPIQAHIAAGHFLQGSSPLRDRPPDQWLP